MADIICEQSLSTVEGVRAPTLMGWNSFERQIEVMTVNTEDTARSSHMSLWTVCSTRGRGVQGCLGRGQCSGGKSDDTYAEKMDLI